jgi:signal peptidase
MQAIRRAAGRLARPTGLLITAGLLLGWFFVLRPTSLGGPAGYAMVSGPSMEPTFRTGDLVITQRADAYHVGDIVLFHVKRGLVIHRIVGGDAASGYVTRGDNNDVEDGFRATPATIDGKAWIHLPGVGQAITFIRQPLPLAICTWVLASVVLLRRWSKPPPLPPAERAPVTDA